MLGEYEAGKECLRQFKEFIIDNKLNERDILILLNENLKQKQINVVNDFSSIADGISEFDATKKIESHINDVLIEREVGVNENVRKNENDIDEGPRYCKKCGCELVSTNKRNLCANCQREKGKGIRNGILTGLGMFMGIIALGWLNDQNGEDTDEVSLNKEDNDDTNA
ncbi:hypothetical protein [Vallitalea longa]|nr:hypothetical protein [Vallitalea longa]